MSQRAVHHKRFNLEDTEDNVQDDTQYGSIAQASEDSDDDAPEVITLQAGKEDAQIRQKAKKELNEKSRQSIKAANQAREAALAARKQQNTSSKSSRKKFKDVEADEDKSSEEDADIRARSRMERAMEQADSESDEERSSDDLSDEIMSDRDIGDGSMANENEDPWGGVSIADDADLEEDEDLNIPQPNSKNTKVTRGPLTSKPKVPIHLPDSLFAAALASKKAEQNSRKTRPRDMENEGEASKKKRRRHSSKPKELLVGNRTLRKISNTPDIASAKTLVPSRRSKQFARNNLKGRKGLWERRSSHLSTNRGIHGPSPRFSTAQVA